MEQKIINIKDIIYIQVDFTTMKNNFLMLVASIVVQNRSVPLYFTMRKYPNKSEQYDHKKMESAFLKGLKHVLSKKFQYVIVADRGFGNKRFIELCETLGFQYMIRVTPNFTVIHDKNQGIANVVCATNGNYSVLVSNWTKQ